MKKHIFLGIVALLIVASACWLIAQLAAWSIPTWFALSVYGQKYVIGISLGVGLVTLFVGLRLNLVRQRKQEQE
jgi:hypothetical protein